MFNNQVLIVIDGSSVLSTAFFGTVPREYHSKKPGDKEKAIEKLMKSSDGRYTNGVYAMTKMLLKLIKNQRPSNIAIAWDISRDTFRRDIYPEYKGTRSETPPELKSQFALMQEVVDAIGIRQFSVDKYEADDILGSLSRRFESEIPVVVITKDQDALQLVTEQTSVWYNTSKAKEMYEDFYGPGYEPKAPDKYFHFTPDTFEHVYGLKPYQMVDKKAIEGDTSDNIPGVKGVGGASAVPLLKHFETVEALYSFLFEKSETEVKELLKEIGVGTRPYNFLMKGKDMATISKKLATIKCDMEEIHALSLNHLQTTINVQATMDKIMELNFKSLIKK